MVNSEVLDSTFGALADPTRRLMIARLLQGEATVSELAAPQTTEASVNPATAQTNTRLRPKRVLNHPDVGIMIAEATI